MKEKSSFIVYYEWEEMFGYMSDKQIADMLRAMFSYAKRGEMPEFSNPLLNSNFCILKYAIDRDAEAYFSRCRKNAENIAKRWNDTKYDGIPKIQSYTKNTDNDNKNDNENNNENNNDKYNISTSSSPTARVGENKCSYSDDFLEFWSAYPKKVGKGAAYKIYQKLKLTNNEKAAILTALNWQKKSEQWLKDGGQFIPYPATYLNQRRWEDEPQSDGICGDITDPNRYIDDEEDFDFTIK